MSFKLRNSNNEEIVNEVNYNLWNKLGGITVINRGNPGSSNPLLLDDFNTIHYYEYNGSDLTNFDISTLMLENAVYEIKFNCSGSSDNNNDMFLIPNHGDYNSSYFYNIFQNSFNIEENTASIKYKSSSNSGGFYFDFFDGGNGFDPVGKITIYNRRNCKKILVEASDTAGSTIGSGYWLDNSTESESYNLDSDAPSYNTTDIWSSVGTLTFTDSSFTDWTVYVSRVCWEKLIYF